MKSPVKSRQLYALLSGIQALRQGTNYPDVQAQTLVAFLTVALHGETNAAALAKTLGTTSASVSRNLSRLSQGFYDDPGLGLIEQWEDPMDRRHKVIKLTPAGQGLAAVVAEAMDKVLNPQPKDN